MHQPLIEHIQKYEGCVPHMYCDSKGIVTVGYGKALFTENQAAALPFKWRVKCSPADHHSIREEWQRVKDLYKPNHKAAYYKRYTQLWLNDGDMFGALNGHLLNMAAELLGPFPELESWSVSAQCAVLDMAYNLGVSGMINKFPTFCAALRAQNWIAAARECRRKGIEEGRNSLTRQWLTMSAHG